MTRARARRVAVVESPPNPGHDYADAFEIRAPQADPRSAEEFARDAIEDAPWPVRTLVSVAHRRVLRFEPGPRSSPDHLFGWRIVRAEPDVVTIEAESSLAKGVIVARRAEPTLARFTTFVTFRSPRMRVLWPVVAPVHRAVAAYLLRHAVARGTPARPRR